MNSLTPLQNPLVLPTATATNVTQTTNSKAATTGRNHTNSTSTLNRQSVTSHAKTRLRGLGFMSVTPSNGLRQARRMPDSGTRRGRNPAWPARSGSATSVSSRQLLLPARWTQVCLVQKLYWREKPVNDRGVARTINRHGKRHRFDLDVSCRDAQEVSGNVTDGDDTCSPENPLRACFHGNAQSCRTMRLRHGAPEMSSMERKRGRAVA